VRDQHVTPWLHLTPGKDPVSIVQGAVACSVPLINRMNPRASVQSGTRQHGWHSTLHCLLPQGYISAGHRSICL